MSDFLADNKENEEVKFCNHHTQIFFHLQFLGIKNQTALSLCKGKIYPWIEIMKFADNFHRRATANTFIRKNWSVKSFIA